MHRTTERRPLAALILTGLVVCGILSCLKVRRLVDPGCLIITTHRVIDETEALQTARGDAEHTAGAYILTGYTKQLAQFPRTGRNLRAVVRKACP